MFIGQFLKGNKLAPQKIQNGRNYAHSQLLNAYIASVGVKIKFIL